MKRREEGVTKSVSSVLNAHKPRRSLMNHENVFKFI
jgi:hypothetical protein